MRSIEPELYELPSTGQHYCSSCIRTHQAYKQLFTTASVIAGQGKRAVARPGTPASASVLMTSFHLSTMRAAASATGRSVLFANFFTCLPACVSSKSLVLTCRTP